MTDKKKRRSSKRKAKER